MAHYRAGPAPEHLRHAFEHALRDYFEGTTTFGSHIWAFNVAARREWNARTPLERLRWASGVLWRCGDEMPQDLCEMLSLPEGATYARGSRTIRAALRGRREVVAH